MRWDCVDWALKTVLAMFSSVLLAVLNSAPSAAQEVQRAVRPDYQQAAQYSTQYLRQFMYDTSVTPRWIGKSDQFWYSYRTSQGTSYFRVDPKSGTKTPLFDRIKLTSQLMEMVQKPLDPMLLSLSRASVSDDGAKLKFVVDDFQFEYELVAELLKKLGKAPPQAELPPLSAAATQEERQRYFELLRQRGDQNTQRRDENQEQRRDEEQQDNQRQNLQQQENQEQNDQQNNEDRTSRSAASGTRNRRPDHRNYSPDRKAYVFAKGHNLFYVELKDEEKNAAINGESKSETEKKVDGEPQEQAETTKPESAPQAASPRAEVDHDSEAIQLSTDGAEDYSFAARTGTSQAGRTDDTIRAATPIPPDRKTRPNVTWSRDSKSFYVSRSDSRGVQDLWVINSLATPRPALEKYKYGMPGEELVRKSELNVFHRDTKKLVRVAPKWKDESYINLQWGKTGEELRFLRRDRLLRHVEYCSANTTTGEAKCLIAEGFENAYLVPNTVRALEDTDELIWWSERSGWGHFYLYDKSGTFKNAITSGPYRASRIIDVDPKNRLLYFTGNAREPNENIYFEHLYSVHLDGTGLTLLDPGDASHRSTLSPSKRFLVDNCSRVDRQPCSVLRDASGRQVMELEKADLSRLTEIGWSLPETFVVKAADGVTDLYGNLWKPFNFDAKKKYPIIAHVYPGPQQEGTNHTFSVTAGDQQLAQLGFIVIQVGHRGGAPTRSKAYASYGYFNLRDYGLADKKAAIEQLAARYNFIDISRVGIYGHSGGGFMTAAALLQKPYNEFFKVGVATSGNHDNNVYNNSWAERYHGLREVAVTARSSTQVGSRGAGGQGSGNTGGSRGRGGTGGGGPGEHDGNQSNGLAGGFSVEAGDYFYEHENIDDDESSFDDAWSHLAEELDPDRHVATGDDGPQDATKAEEAKNEVSKAAEEKKTRFEIRVPTNAELASNLKGHLLLVHGELDNNVHPANTLRLVDALIKANKRFDMLYLPGKRHGYGDYQPYVTQRMYEYFAEHLLGDYQPSADIGDKAAVRDDRR